MDLIQSKADEWIDLAKEVARKDAFTWALGTQQEELVIAVGNEELKFLLTLKRNPYEIKSQLRTRDRHIPLMRMDNAVQHINPDGTVVRGPHVHRYREGWGLAWAESIDWYDADRPVETLFRFLDLVRTHFPNGFQEALL